MHACTLLLLWSLISRYLLSFVGRGSNIRVVHKTSHILSARWLIIWNFINAHSTVHYVHRLLLWISELCIHWVILSEAPNILYFYIDYFYTTIQTLGVVLTQAHGGSFKLVCHWWTFGVYLGLVSSTIKVIHIDGVFLRIYYSGLLVIDHHTSSTFANSLSAGSGPLTWINNRNLIS